MTLVMLLTLLNIDEDQSKEKVKLVDFIAKRNIFRPWKAEPIPIKDPTPKPKPVMKKIIVEKRFPYYVRGFATEKGTCFAWIEKEESGNFMRLKAGDTLFNTTIVRVSLDEVIISEGDSKKSIKFGDKIADEIIKEEKWVEENSGG